MNSDEFEQRLGATPMREIPADWRAQILAKAAPVEEPRAKGSWRDLLWPSPLAWGALACIWIAILAVDAVSSRSQPQPTATAGAQQPKEIIQMRFAQERSLDENREVF